MWFNTPLMRIFLLLMTLCLYLFYCNYNSQLLLGHIFLFILHQDFKLFAIINYIIFLWEFHSYLLYWFLPTYWYIKQMFNISRWLTVCLVLSRVQLSVTQCPVAHQAPLSIGILQARVLEWVAIYLLQGIFPMQGSNPGLPHCRKMFFYCLSHRGSPGNLLKPDSSNQRWHFHISVHLMRRGTGCLYSALSSRGKYTANSLGIYSVSPREKVRSIHSFVKINIVFTSHVWLLPSVSLLWCNHTMFWCPLTLFSSPCGKLFSKNSCKHNA